ncbi:hypothetical protein [Rhodopila sp.]|uniref:hypothetical protein n=1 Tax=Rhodopila sp. TaxID=2480087 RepID=UPI003D0E135A
MAARLGQCAATWHNGARYQRGFLPLADIWQGQVQLVASNVNMLKPHPVVPTIQHPLSVYKSLLVPQAMQ